jgi:opacity protein-like surface antigen
MKKAIVILAVVAALTATTAIADEIVNGYMRQDGTYVQPHFRSSPNSTKIDNYSSQGNTNPYTGERGSQRNEDNPYGQSQKRGAYGR